MPYRARLLGFAFANADLLFEVDRENRIAFATGAVHDYVRDAKADLVGLPAARLFQPSEGAKFATLTHSLGAGGRAGPFKLKLADGTDAALSLFRLPQNKGNVSCTLARPEARTVAGGKGGSDREGFLAAVAGLSGGKSELALVEVPGLDRAVSKLPAEAAQKLLQRIGETARNAGAKAAVQLSDTRFGAVGGASFADGIVKVLKEGGIEARDVQETLVSLKTRALSPEQLMLSLRYVIDRFTEQADVPATDLSSAFDKLMGETEARALALTQTVADGSFSLGFQPVVDLKTQEVSYWEALARFPDGADTGEIVGFAEALGIADAFDLAVAIKIIAHALKPENATQRIAFNVSGRTLSQPAAFGMLAGILARNRALAPRILIEITESFEIKDIAQANQAILSLRELGYKVGLDDFGAGATSLQYLHGLHVDFVKMDGTLIQRLGKSTREDTLLRGIVKLCAELNLTTIAECVENETLLARARDIGFVLGQGHHLGKPAATLPAATSQPIAHRAKRQGVQESWG
ncbi:MAG TPA: EAL domain-containing protein [Rhizomicrobium sp.]|nr:EAL domain-containing protein [Rhizomicrobium sp.]